MKATRAICAQVVVTFVKHIGIQSACGPNSIKTDPASTSPAVCELKVSGALGELLWLVTTFV